MDLPAVSASRLTANAALLPPLRSRHKNELLKFYLNGTKIKLMSVDYEVGKV